MINSVGRPLRKWCIHLIKPTVLRLAAPLQLPSFPALRTKSLTFTYNTFVQSPLVSGAAGALARIANSATPVVDASLQSRGRATPVFSGGDHDGGMRNPTYAGPTGFAGPGGSAADSQLLGGGGGRKALPWTRIAVVALDGAIDGLTLGIASSIGLKEAALIAVAMTLEMCFVGVALSCKIRESNRSALITYAIVMVVPLFMYVVSCTCPAIRAVVAVILCFCFGFEVEIGIVLFPYIYIYFVSMPGQMH